MSGTHRIQRINFIDQERLDFSYRKLLGIGLLLVAACGFLYGAQFLRIRLMDQRIVALSAEVVTLKTEQARIKKENAAVSDVPVTARSTLAALFQKSLGWSLILREFSRLTPSSLWLTSLKSYEKAEASAKKGILLGGFSKDMETLARFVKILSDSDFFEKVILTTSAQDKSSQEPRYQFAIDVAVKRSSSP